MTSKKWETSLFLMIIKILDLFLKYQIRRNKKNSQLFFYFISFKNFGKIYTVQKSSSFTIVFLLDVEGVIFELLHTVHSQYPN